MQSTSNAGVPWEKVTLDMLQSKEGTLLKDELSAHVQTIAKEAADLGTDGKGTITISIKVGRTGEHGAILLGTDVTVKHPKQKRRALTAWVQKDGELQSQEHKQIPLAAVSRIGGDQ